MDNERIDDILHKLNTNAQAERASCTERGNWEGYNFKYNKFEDEARLAIEKLLIEARIDEIQQIETKNIFIYPGMVNVHSRIAELQDQLNKLGDK